MKHFILSSICLLPIFALFVIGCDLDMPDLGEGAWDEDPYDPGWSPDSSTVYSVSISLVGDTVLYAPGDTAEVSGCARVRNYYGQPLHNVALQFCVSDNSASLVWSNSGLRNRTDAAGEVNFTVRCVECAGEISVTTSAGYYRSADHVFILPANRRPVYLEACADPDTVYIDTQHPDSVTLRLLVTDAGHQPIPGFIVRSAYLNPNRSDCSQFYARTDSEGNVSVTLVLAENLSSPFRRSYLFSVGGLSDTAYVYLMPWDSTHGG